MKLIAAMKRPTLYDCPASSTRTRKPIRGAVPAVALNESMLVEVGETGHQPAINKGKPTKPGGGYRTSRPAMEASKERTPFVLLNAEAGDAGSENYATAIAVSALAVHNATGASFAVYAHFDWSEPDAHARWCNMLRAYGQFGVWPDYITISGHWYGQTMGEVLAKVAADTAIVRRVVGPHWPIIVVVSPWDYGKRGDQGRSRTKETYALKKHLMKAGRPVIWWYEPNLVRGK